MTTQSTRPSIRDVAKAAGISVSTVSRALNDHPDVAQSTRQRIQALAKDMGFEFNPFARGLLNGRTGLSALVAGEFQSEYTNLILRGLTTAAQERGLEVLLSPVAGPGDVLSSCTSLHRRGFIEGAIVLAHETVDEEALQMLQEKGFPLVVINSSGTLPSLSSVTAADFAGAYESTEHLIALGHRRIGVIGKDHLSQGIPRVDGAIAAMRDRGIQVDTRLVAVEPTGTQEAGRRAVSRWLDAGIEVTAITCFNDLMAYGVFHELSLRGIAVPQQISLIGFDDLPHSQYLGPGLTTTQQPIEAIGHRAMFMLADLQAGLAQPGIHAVEPTRLIVRGSTAAPATSS